MAQGTISLSGTGSTTIPFGTNTFSQFMWHLAGVPGAPNPASNIPITEAITVDLTSTTTRFLFIFTRTTWAAVINWDVSIPLTLTWASN